MTPQFAGSNSRCRYRRCGWRPPDVVETQQQVGHPSSFPPPCCPTTATVSTGSTRKADGAQHPIVILVSEPDPFDSWRGVWESAPERPARPPRAWSSSPKMRSPPPWPPEARCISRSGPGSGGRCAWRIGRTPPAHRVSAPDRMRTPPRPAAAPVPEFPEFDHGIEPAVALLSLTHRDGRCLLSRIPGRCALPD